GEAGTSAQGSLELRKEAAIDGLRIFAENPVSGVGPGNFKLYRRLRGDASTLEAHNVYIHVLGELGAIGGAAVLAILGGTCLKFGNIRRLSKNTVTGEGRFLQALALAGTNSLILLAYTGMTGSNFSRFNWYWLAGLGVSGLTICRDGFLYNTPEELD